MTVYGTLKSLYRLVPGPARQGALDRAPRPVRDLHYRLVSRLERGAEKDELYDRYYFERVVDPMMVPSAEAIARSIQLELQPRSVIDVGCGTGALMDAFERLGIGCFGFDRAPAALEACRGRDLTVRRLDIEADPFPDERADVVVSTEVAEHLAESVADRFVELVTTLAPVAVVTAALPGMRGKGHVNTQQNEYWIAKFEERGFPFDRDLSMRLRENWATMSVDPVFFRSVMVFRSDAR
jgi:SAM-dependent methyltransferase